MRPVFSNLESVFGSVTSTQQPLIASSHVGYDRRMLPVDVEVDHRENRLINPLPYSGEAEMDRDRSDHSTSDSPSHRIDQANNGSEGGFQEQPETIDERLARIRAEIAAGVYETPEKLEIAVSRMLGLPTD